MSIEGNCTLVRQGDMVDNTDECGLACSIRTKQSEYLSARYVHADIVQCYMVGKGFPYTVDFNK